LKSLRSASLCLGALTGIVALAAPPAIAQSAPATSQAATASAPAPLVAPPAESVKAYDRPSDDGSMIIVEWARPEKETAGHYYVVEIARSREDFEAGRFKEQVVRPSARARRSAEPKYFGFSLANETRYVAQVSPAKHFPPAPRGELTAGRLDKLADEGVLSSGERDRGLSALRIERPDDELSPEEKDRRAWFGRLKDYLARTDEEALEDERAEINRATWYFRLAATDGTRKAYVSRDGRPVVFGTGARANLFKRFKLNNLIFALAFSTVVLTFIQVARRNPNLFIRKIPGLEAVEEAIGRAAEMGRPVFFVHGLHDMGSLSTIAAVSILARVARRSAEYDVRVRVMNNRPIVTAVSQEVVQQAYTEAGRPDAYDPDDVSLVATDQFSYVAAVSGLMVREQPAAVFLLGYFYAESLLLAETGASTGAIQVAGTDAYTQLPFFVTTCDYTLIGEELYAASAYLSREPRMLGSLRGQDVGKVFLMLAMVGGTIAMSIGRWLAADLSLLRSIFEALGG